MLGSCTSQLLPVHFCSFSLPVFCLLRRLRAKNVSELDRKLSLVSSNFSLTSSCAQTSWLLAHRACRLLQLQLTCETLFNCAKASANLDLQGLHERVQLLAVFRPTRGHPA